MSDQGVEAGRLVVCPTPIGNLGDVTLRVLESLRDADIVACEDTRRTRVLLDRHDVGRLPSELVSYHEYNERDRLESLLERMRAGATVALVSDAGMPLISDPGFGLLRACLEEEIAVSVLPGASSVTTALVSSGMASGSWTFVGFLPRKRAERERLLEHTEGTVVAFESPRRLPATLAQLAERDPDRPLAVCRELTKLHEEIRRGTAAELAAHYGSAPKGEVVLVVGAIESDPAHPAGSSPIDPRRGKALQALRDLVDAGARPRPAATVVAKLTGIGANELYRELVGADTAVLEGIPDADEQARLRQRQARRGKTVPLDER